MTQHLELSDVYRARSVVSQHLQKTPLLRSQPLSEQLGCDLWIKYENCTPIRSFKARGGIYRLSTLGDDIAGVATASTGNHGQGIALGARIYGKRAVVMVPKGTNPVKMAAMAYLGAELREVDGDIGAANRAASVAAQDENLLHVEDGADPDVMLGAATLALEILEQLPTFDDLVVQVGGGNLIGAMSLVLRDAAPHVRMTGIQPLAAPAIYESWIARAFVESERCDTFAGGLAANFPGSFALDYWKDYVDKIVPVPDHEFVEAAMIMLCDTGHLPEGAGAAGLAGVLREPERYQNKRVVILLSGSNAEQRIYDRVLRD